MSDNTENNVSISNDELNDDDDNVVTMVDVLEEEKKLEEDAFAVLGASDDKNCTYNQGYVKRQALYACKTCLPVEEKVAAGICLACSYHCHEGHDLVELYTKRNFRCDCGNSLFNGKKCNLEPNKSEVNENNKYNRNFGGLYCTCARPYPDPEDSVFDEMIQCIVCEDWYHTRHLEAAVPSGDDYCEVICAACTEKLPFLQHYLQFSVCKVKKDTEDGEVNVDGPNNDAPQTGGDEICKVEIKIESPSAEDKTVKDSDESKEDKMPDTKAVDNITKDEETVEKNMNGACKVTGMPLIPRTTKGASFWRDGFRSALCKCQKCQAVYASLEVSFLADTSDTVQAYEEEGQARVGAATGVDSPLYEKGLKALSSLDRVSQVEAIHEYNQMQQRLKEYLAKFAENKKVVRKEDIVDFFKSMEPAAKRRKVQVPHFCH